MKNNLRYKILRNLNFLVLIRLSTKFNGFLETEIKEINKVGILTISMYIFVIFLFGICPYIIIINETINLGLDIKFTFFLFLYIIIAFINFTSFKKVYLHDMTEKYLKLFKPSSNRVLILNLKDMTYILISWLIFLIIVILMGILI